MLNGGVVCGYGGKGFRRLSLFNCLFKMAVLFPKDEAVSFENNKGLQNWLRRA